MLLRKFVLAALLLSCTSPTKKIESLYEVNDFGEPLRHCRLPIPFAISINVPEKFHRVVYDAFEYWDDQTPHDLFVYRGVVELWADDPNNGRLIVVGYPYDAPNEHSLASVFRSGVRGGCIRFSSMYLYTDMNKHNHNSLERMFRHEVGHILGFRHVKDPAALMFPTVNYVEHTPLQATEYEIQQFKLYYFPK